MSRFLRLDVWIVLAGVLLLTLLGPIALSTELALSVTRIVAIDNGGEGQPNPAQTLALQSGGTLVLADTNGQYRVVAVPDGVAVGSQVFAPVEDRRPAIEVRGFDNQVRFTVPGPGYPALVGQSLIVAARGGTGLHAYDLEGRERWHRSFDDLVTHVTDLPQDQIAVQLLGGGLVVMGSDGRELGQWQSTGSRRSVGLGLASMGPNLFVLDGIEPQVLHLVRVSPRGNEVAFEVRGVPSQTNFRRDVLLQIVANKSLIALEDEGGLSLLDLEGRSLSHLGGIGYITRITEDPGRRLLYLVSEDSQGSYLRAISWRGREVFRFGPFQDVQDAAVGKNSEIMAPTSAGLVALGVSVQ